MARPGEWQSGGFSTPTNQKCSGTIVLHVSPESAVEGSVLGVVRDRDIISFDLARRLLQLEVKTDEIEERLRQKKAERESPSAQSDLSKVPVLTARRTRRGYRGLYERCVNQAHEGADFDFLTASGPRR